MQGIKKEIMTKPWKSMFGGKQKIASRTRSLLFVNGSTVCITSDIEWSGKGIQESPALPTFAHALHSIPDLIRPLFPDAILSKWLVLVRFESIIIENTHVLVIQGNV